jgi:imidazolonepropionase-like amidohydrolase
LKIFAAAQAPPFSTLPVPAIRAAADEAHRRSKPVFTHPTSREGLLASLAGGVDIIAHTTPQSGDWDNVVLTAMRQAKAALIPTVKIWKYQMRHDRLSIGESRAQAAVGQLRSWLSSGGVVLFGTDAGGMDDYDPADEYSFMAQAGMTFRQILAALTTDPAAEFGDARRLGRIAPGFAADLVVLGRDPSRDVRALAQVRYTLRDGKIIYRAPR